MPEVMTISPVATSASDTTYSRRRVPSACPWSTPWAREPWIMAETPDWSSVMSRTVDVLAETSMICPITPPELHTGIPTSNPEAEPLSMITESVQASPVEPMIRAAVDSRL